MKLAPNPDRSNHLQNAGDDHSGCPAWTSDGRRPLLRSCHQRPAKSVTVVDALTASVAVDGLLWLGSADEGATVLSRLRLQGSTVPFWTTAVAGDPVFHSLLMERLDGTPPGAIYWTIALGENGDQYMEWASAHEDATPTDFTVYLATQRALQKIAGDDLPSHERELAVFDLDLEGNSELIEIVRIP